MGSIRESDCSALLLDLLWYETVARRLSPEMEAILACHLSGCRVCRTRFDEFKAAHRSASRMVKIFDRAANSSTG